MDWKMHINAQQVAEQRARKQGQREEARQLLRPVDNGPEMSTDAVPEDMEVQAYQLVDYLKHAAETRRLERQYWQGAPEPAGIHVRRLQEADARTYMLEERVIHADSDEAIAEAVADKLLVIRHEYERNEDRALYHAEERERNRQLSGLADGLISGTLKALGLGVMHKLVESDSETGFLRKKIRHATLYD